MSEPAPSPADGVQVAALPDALVVARFEGRRRDAPAQASPDAERPDPANGRSRSGFLAALGPGLITGAADDDPSGIATYSQAGAQFGFSIAWTMLFSYPLMVAIQEISARIGRTTGRGIAGNLRAYYPRPVLSGLVALLIAANTINIGADLGAMGDAVRLLIGGNSAVYVVLLAVLCAGVQIFVQYARYVSVLKWLTLSLFAYFGTVLFVKLPYGELARGVFVPTFSSDVAFWTTVVAILGTTISPYLFFWQASQEVEDERALPTRRPLVDAPEQAPDAIRRIRQDTYVGMAFSNLAALAIIITTAATLHAAGKTDIQTTSQAAEALRPVAGRFAFTIFSLGILGTGLLAIPVLAGSAAYALGEARRWPIGLARDPLKAKAFYATIAIATLVGAAVSFSPLDPIKALFWSAVINGVASAPIMVLTMLMASRADVMGEVPVTGLLRWLGWLSTAVMGAAVAFMFWSMAAERGS